MNVDLGPEVSHRHRRALDVPARPAGTERRLPGRLAGRRRAPEDEVECVAPGARADLSEQAIGLQLQEHRAPGPLGQCPERGETGRLEVEISLGSVGIAGGSQFAAGLDDARDLLADTRHPVGGPPPEDAHLVHELGLLFFGELLPVSAVPPSPLEQGVVNVGDVLDVGDFHPTGLGEADEDIEGQERKGVAEVTGVVGGDPTDVNAHLGTAGPHSHRQRNGRARVRVVNPRRRAGAWRQTTRQRRCGWRPREARRPYRSAPTAHRCRRARNVRTRRWEGKSGGAGRAGR